MAKLLLGVSGGIAAFKALEFVRLATERGHAVRVIQTHSSKRFVGTASFRRPERSAGPLRRVRTRPAARLIPGRAAGRA
ncbi:MAG: flavoprotein [Solirubrobacteraceae bacterium]